MIKKFILILCVIAVVAVAAANPLYRTPVRKILQSYEHDSADDLEDGADKDDLKSSASHGYGYYGYPFGGFYSGYPYSYGGYSGYGRYFGGYYPYGHGYGYGLHGHYF